MNAFDDRILNLQQVFVNVQNTRMQGVPVINEALRVEAVGFEKIDPATFQGVLVTPWFMNLVRMPLSAEPPGNRKSGDKISHSIGTEKFEFILGFEEGLGSFEACSLFSPMFEFADQSSAVAVAREVLNHLKQLQKVAQAAPQQPARRGFLTGRFGS